MTKEFISNLPILSIITPLFAAFLLGLFKDKFIGLKKAIAVVATGLAFLATLLLIKPILIDNSILVNWMGSWIPFKGVAFGIGLEVDALSLFVGLIITTASFLSVIYSLKYMSKDNGISKYYVLFLLLTASMIGFVFTGDLFNMYVMLEIMTISAISLTAFRNYKDKSMEAAFKYIVTGSLGSSLILLGTALVYLECKTLNLAQISADLLSKGELSPIAIIAIALMLVGYGVKSFMVPCHTWPTDAHMTAPSSISMILSGVMSKTGVYGLIRLMIMVFGLINNKSLGMLILLWGILTMVVGVSMALLQHDFKRLLAFHSVSQIGYIITSLGLGILQSGAVSALAFTGSVYHMVNHSIFKGLLFLTAGAILYVTGTTDLDHVSGLGKKMPFTMAMFLFGAAAISGIPPFNGFASKWIIYQAGLTGPYGIVTVIAVLVSALTLASFIKVGHSAFFGPLRKEHKEIQEVPFSMKLPMVILAALTVVFGVLPKTMIKYLLFPAVKAMANVQDYVMAALGNSWNGVLTTSKFADSSFEAFGVYEPANFLILFIILFVAVVALMMLRGQHGGEELRDGQDSVFDLSIYQKYKDETKFNKQKTQARFTEGCKYDVFVGGEEGDKVKVGPNDLFWGLKYQFKGYFTAISEAHSGNINDYSLWIVSTLAVVTIFVVIFL